MDMKASALLLLWTLSAAGPVHMELLLDGELDLSDALGFSGNFMDPDSESTFTMTTPKMVDAMRGDNTLLLCSFTHPRIRNYSGTITVKWFARRTTIPPFFTCVIQNLVNIRTCSSPEQKYTLAGNPREGVLSLLIRDVTLVDEELYFCRVELEGEGDTSRGINLRVRVKPKILVLKEQNGNNTGHLLECVAEGKPLPYISWFSKSKGHLEGFFDVHRSGPYYLTSNIWWDKGDRITCRAENPLGQAEQTYPMGSSLVLMVRVGVFVGVLLLTMGLLICKLRHFRCSDAGESQHSRCPTEEGSQGHSRSLQDPTSHFQLDENPTPLSADSQDFSRIYQNRADFHLRLQSPAGGSVKPRPDFCTVDVHSLSQPARAAGRRNHV